MAKAISNNVNKCHTLPDGFFSNKGKTDSCLKRLTGRILASLWLLQSLYILCTKNNFKIV